MIIFVDRYKSYILSFSVYCICPVKAFSRQLWILVLKYETFTKVQQEKLLLLELASMARSQKVSRVEISLCVCVCAIFVRRKCLCWCSEIDVV